ncbi:PAS-domain containing protein [Nitrobacter sp. TKz-YC02]|uniref:PAS-domain containing protein n=1 Tax=Nitrobacter sp. TKz-YC02 TaxID=3398704 RepID=UPI003CEB74C8
MHIDWRTMLGPAFAILIASASIYADRNVAAFPDLSALYICVVALAGSLGGTVSGLISAGIAVLASAGILNDYNATVVDGSIVFRLGLLTLAAGGTALITGLLRLRMMNALRRERERHATAARLSTALNQTDIGIVMLDADTRAEFINRAFRNYFSLPDEKADSKPPFIALMYHGRDTGAYELPQDELSHFISERVGMVRAGDPTPINIKLRNGEVLRFICTALPDGGRMLSYAPVTDLIRRTDNPADADYYLSLRGIDRRLPIHRLRAAE